VAIGPDHLQQIQAACSAADLKPNRVVLRSYASASLFTRTVGASPRVCLLVDRVGDEADLTLLVEGKPILLRTVRLPHASDPEQAQRRLLAEIRRTLAVAPDEHVGEGVECVYVFGRLEEQAPLAELVRAELGLSAEVFDVFASVGLPA